MTAPSDTGVAYTPRYIEGVCFGEYNTDTNEFVPTTNPVVIPRGALLEFDEQINDKGNNVVHVSGYQIDKGADLVRKGSVKGFSMRPSNIDVYYDHDKLNHNKAKNAIETQIHTKQ